MVATIIDRHSSHSPAHTDDKVWCYAIGKAERRLKLQVHAQDANDISAFSLDRDGKRNARILGNG